MLMSLGEALLSVPMVQWAALLLVGRAGVHAEPPPAGQEVVLRALEPFVATNLHAE